MATEYVIEERKFHEINHARFMVWQDIRYVYVQRSKLQKPKRIEKNKGLSEDKKKTLLFEFLGRKFYYIDKLSGVGKITITVESD